MPFKANATDPDNITKQYWYNKIVSVLPNMANDASIQANGNPEQVYRNLVDIGLIKDGVEYGSTIGVNLWGKVRVGFIGDSITAGGESYTANMAYGENNDSVSLYAMLQSANGNWQFIQNAGVSGQNSSQILARLQADILANNVDICIIYSCTWNDIGQGFTLSQSLANVTSMITQCLAANVIPVLCTPTPDGQTGSSASRRNQAAQRRRSFIELGRKYNIPVLDLFPLFVDVTTGMISSTYNGDGSVHPNLAGRKAAGQFVANFLDNFCKGAPADIGYVGDTDDTLGGIGFFLNTPTNGVAGGWSNSLVTGCTASIFSDSTLGTMQRVTTASSTSNGYLVKGGVPWVSGHKYEISGYISKAGTSFAQLSINSDSGVGNRRVTIDGAGPDISRGRFNVVCIPQNNTSGTATLYLAVGPGTGTVDFGRFTIRDLTALGIN